MALQPGDKLGPYEVLAPIGNGGMGEVWKARDTRLNRIVAIKWLKGQHTTRFQQEARAIAALNHPNICQVYDVGPDYLVMEYVEGKPLQGPLRVEEAIKLALQIAGALEEAHEKDILHRDLKPANILVTAKGAAKLLDFGLAKLMTDSDTNATNTIEGTVLGTAAYMAPEQAEGKQLDVRSDIFSFGAVLYEMFAGKRAFGGTSIAQVLSAVLRDDPAPLQAPTELQRIVGKCLAKQPGARFPNVAELRTALEQATAAVPNPIEKQNSIAVLPFANMSSDDDEYFSDGLAEEIINALTQIADLKVIARTSAFAFKGKNEDIRKIAEALGVSSVLEGSVRRAGGRLRITAQLIHAADGTHLWSQRYDREMTDIFAIQDEISAAIADQLQVHLTGRARQSTNLAAYEALLEGRHHFYKATPAGVTKALSCFARAIQNDPAFALAYASTAECHQVLAGLGISDPRESFAKGKPFAERALQIDPSVPEGHAQMGVLYALMEHDWSAAEPHFRRALQLNPRLRHVQMPYALWYLRPQGRLDEAVAAFDVVLEQDPLAAVVHGVKAQALFFQGHYDAAAASAVRAIEIDAYHPYAQFTLGQIRGWQKRFEEAFEIANGLIQMHGRFFLPLYLLADIHALAGHPQEAHKLLDELAELGRNAYVPASGIAMIHGQLGEPDEAFEWAARAIEERDPFMTWIKLSPAYDSIRSDARYLTLLQNMNLT